MIDLEKLRRFAQGLIDERDHAVAESGIAGAGREVVRAEVAHELLTLLDAPGPPMTAKERIPPVMMESLERYASHGLRPGHCLRAVLEGDIYGAMSRADERTMLALPAIVAWIRANLSTAVYGSREIVDRWIARPRS